MMTEEGPGGALVADIANKIQHDFFSGLNPQQAFLPPERKLTAEYAVSRTTMRGALALLTQLGYVRAEHGRGYRILKKTEKDFKTPRIAVLQASATSTIYQGRTSQVLIDAMQRESLKRKWQVLNIDVEDLSPNQVISELIDANVQAVGMVFANKEIVDALLKAQIPCICLENSANELKLDYICQDNIGGARKAANYLLSKGHQRIAWVGPIKDSFTSYMRWSGANSVLIEKDLSILKENVIADHNNIQELVYKMLSKKDGPTGILSLWSRQTIETIKAVKELNLKVGKDLDVVGWCNQNRYKTLITEELPRNMVPPMIVWSPDKMAEVAINRLLLHTQQSSMDPLNIAVPTRLVHPK